MRVLQQRAHLSQFAEQDCIILRARDRHHPIRTLMFILVRRILLDVRIRLCRRLCCGSAICALPLDRG